MASSRKGEPDLTGRVLARLRALLRPGERIALGYSGGLDSSVLLRLLAELAPILDSPLQVIHVHHGLSANADAWVEHCRATCADLAVPLEVHHVRVEPNGDGPEAAARAARYAVYADLDTDVLLLAHHRDDQAETVLGQMLRGGRARGLAAMPESRTLPGRGVRLLRPLLDTARAELLTWARARGMVWVEDESNAQARYARNALRHHVLPGLEARFPGASATLARAAERFAEMGALLDDLADLDGRDAVASGGLLVSRLAGLPEARARNLLRRYLAGQGAEIHPDALREGLRQLLEAGADARLQVDFGPILLRRHDGRAWAVPRCAPIDPHREWIWHGEARVDLGEGWSLAFRPATGAGVRLEPGRVTVRFRRGGESLRGAANRPTRPLKDLLREAAIPPWRRDRLPLVYQDERLAWVAGIGPDVGALAGPGESGWLISLDTPW